MKKGLPSVLCFCTACISPLCASFSSISAQTAHSLSSPQNKTENPISFDVASIKPANPKGGPMGAYTYPGGKVFIGHSTLKMLVQYAFDVQSFQVTGGPRWVDDDSYDVVGQVPPSSESSRSRPVSRNAPLNEEQRKMLQNLLIERFALKVHKEIRQGNVFVLSCNGKSTQMKPTADPHGLPYLLSPIKPGGVVDGELIGNNISMSLLTARLSRYLERPVIDQTGLTASFDFHLPVSDPTNQDLSTGLIGALSRLGLRLKSAKGPVETIVIDSAAMPTPN